MADVVDGESTSSGVAKLKEPSAARSRPVANTSFVLFVELSLDNRLGLNFCRSLEEVATSSIVSLSSTSMRTSGHFLLSDEIDSRALRADPEAIVDAGREPVVVGRELLVVGRELLVVGRELLVAGPDDVSRVSSLGSGVAI